MDDLHFQIKQDKDIVYLKGIGSWKSKVSEDCVHLINTYAVQQQHHQFALIVDTSEMRSVVPNGVEAWHDAIEFWVDSGLQMITRVDNPEATFDKGFVADLDDIFRYDTRFMTSNDTDHALLLLHKAGFEGFEH